MPKKQIPFEPEVSGLPFSPVVQIGNHFHFSGTLPAIKDKKPVSQTLVEQTREVLEKMKAMLEKCGLSLNDIFHATIMLSGNMDGYDEVNAIYSETLKEAGAEIMPARKAFAVAGLPFGALIEIEYEAVKQD